MTQNEKHSAQDLTDSELDSVSAARNLGETVGGKLKATIASFIYDEDGNLARKELIADAASGGNVNHGGQAPAGNTYTFDEEIDGELIPVTYQVN